MTLNYYKTPFHATELDNIADELTLKTDLLIMIRDLINKKQWSDIELCNNLKIDSETLKDIKEANLDNLDLIILFLILFTFKRYNLTSK